MRAAERLAGQVIQPGNVLRALIGVAISLGLACWAVSDSFMEVWVRLADSFAAVIPAMLAWLLVAWIISRSRWDIDLSSYTRRLDLILGVMASVLTGISSWSCALIYGMQPSLFRCAGIAVFAGALAVCHLKGIRARHSLLTPAEQSSRLQELQARIRPHFLFNTLNTALTLVQVSPAKAEMVLENLAELFRAALEDNSLSATESTLGEEIELARKYLEIERLRFGSRLRVQWHVDRRADSAKVPRLLLQPLVENAVRHGVEPSRDGADIDVMTRWERGIVRVTVSNTVVTGSSAPGHGIALQNVRERLSLMHDLSADLRVAVRDGRYQVDIELHGR
jgi:two-component system, LytTR family, sensor histidine kinase AlgZ